MSLNKEKREELESQAAEIQEKLTETVTEYKKVGNQMLIAGGQLPSIWSLLFWP